MSLRVVIYAEGAGELGGELPPPPAPGDPLQDHHLGPAHVLAARSIERVRRIPAKAVRFELGLRKSSTTDTPRGSDLIQRKTLLRLLTWPLNDMRPELAIVLVDEDGDRGRHATMRDWIKEPRPGRPTTVIAVARQEFESWLVTDQACVSSVLGGSLDSSGSPEDWKPTEAKRILQSAIGRSERSATDARARRRDICATCDLDKLKQGSHSFARFLDELKNP